MTPVLNDRCSTRYASTIINILDSDSRDKIKSDLLGFKNLVGLDRDFKYGINPKNS